MIEPRRPDASSPGPRGPEAFSPAGGSCLRAALAAPDIRPSCQRTSARTISCRAGAASTAAFAAYAAAPSACAPICGTAAACPAARAAATAAGALTSRAAAPLTNRRRISPATSSSPRANARARAIASRGRRSPGASASNNPSTRSAQSAAHTATIRRSASLSVCGDRTTRFSQACGRWNLHAAQVRAGSGRQRGYCRERSRTPPRGRQAPSRPEPAASTPTRHDSGTDAASWNGRSGD